ncbi:MAG: histidinol dehydrogenase [Planctomycetota bacterium]
MTLLPQREAASVRAAAGDALPPDTLATAAQIVADVESGGDAIARRYATELGDIQPDAPMWLGRDAMREAFDALPVGQQQLLRAVAGRIQSFAQAQRESIREFDFAVEGGTASQRMAPVATAGCYAPGGRATLPSSLLMTAVTARAAGVATVLAASPRPGPIVLGAAYVADCDGLLAIGGAQAVAALAFGDRTEGAATPRAGCDVLVGPGNRFVTAAKQLVQGRVGIDLPAGPSELCILADHTADPALVAADLLAQAEHDPDARTWLITTCKDLVPSVREQLAAQLDGLATRDVAAVALAAGGAVHCATLEEAEAVCDRLAPEHLQLVLAPDAADRAATRLQHYGALFFGRNGAEVLGDYGAGPNHVLPTAGAARFTGGLSVFTFLRVRTWLKLDRAANQLLEDAADLADLEGLPGHAAAARRRLSPSASRSHANP